MVTFFRWFIDGVPSGEWELCRACGRGGGDKVVRKQPVIATVPDSLCLFDSGEKVGDLRPLFRAIRIMALCDMARIWGFLDRFSCAFHERKEKREESVS